MAAQQKIYIVNDLEGVRGVFKFKQTREKDTPLNIQACEYFMDDLSAVVRGLWDGGATELLVLDGHGNQYVIPHMMEPGVKFITGTPRPGPMWGLDDSFAGYYSVPTILVTGDMATCWEAEQFFGKACVMVAVKEGIAREAALLYPFEETRLYTKEPERPWKNYPNANPMKSIIPFRGNCNT